MIRVPVRLAAIAVAATAISLTCITAASAGPSPGASERGTEHFTFMVTLTGTGVASVIATGLFTDGGSVDLGSAGPLKMKLGAGTIRLTTTNEVGSGVKYNRKTCLQTLTGRGIYRLSHGTGKYAGIHGSGSFTTTIRSVLPRRASGACATGRRPLAFQGVVTLSGPATLS
jgi:hypothetical protein